MRRLWKCVWRGKAANAPVKWIVLQIWHREQYPSRIMIKQTSGDQSEWIMTPDLALYPVFYDTVEAISSLQLLERGKNSGYIDWEERSMYCTQEYRRGQERAIMETSLMGDCTANANPKYGLKARHLCNKALVETTRSVNHGAFFPDNGNWDAEGSNDRSWWTSGRGLLCREKKEDVWWTWSLLRILV